MAMLQPLIRAYAHIFLLALLTTHCGGTAPTNDTGDAVGGTHVQVTKRAAATHPLGQIAAYTIAVSGPGFETVETTMASDATEAVLDGIPAGEARQVSVSALNEETQRIWSGEARDVVIPAGEVVEVPIALQPIPIFANVRDGSVVTNTRLRPMIVAPPGTTVAMLQAPADGTGTPEPVVDVALGAVNVPIADASGLVQLRPAPLPPGRYQLVVEDTATHRTSTVSVTIVDGTRRRGAPFYAAAGAATPRSWWLRIGGVGW
ncbi:MAG: hypothetical protein HY696_05530 [Deltaproteobacteria bacterium]|nr:hypothetical protein [Deltaproteobacteria bacterium]